MVEDNSDNLEVRRQALRDDLLGELKEPCEVRQNPDGAEWFEAGDPPEVVVRLKGYTVSVYRYEMTWRGPHEPRATPKLLGTVNWRQTKASTVDMICHMLIADAREHRRAKFRTCRYCRKVFGPEHMHSDDVCHGCAERHLGVVH